MCMVGHWTPGACCHHLCIRCRACPCLQTTTAQCLHDLQDDKQRATIRTWYHGVKPNKLFDANNQSSLPWSCVVRPGINIGSCSMQVIAARAHDLAMRDLHGANVRSSDLNMSDDTWALVSSMNSKSRECIRAPS